MAPTRIRKAKKSELPERLRPRKSPSQRRAKGLVSAVLEAGSRVLLERGYERLSMQRVAQVAGVSPGSLYQYFPDKAALVAALVEGISERELAFQLERFAQLPADATLAQALEHMVRGVLAFQHQEGPLMRRGLEAMAHLGRYPALTARVSDAARGLELLLEAHRPRCPSRISGWSPTCWPTRSTASPTMACCLAPRRSTMRPWCAR